MPEDTTTDIDPKYQLFIEKVAASKLVWALKDKNGWANADSHENETFTVIPFWSERAFAKACAKQDWSGYGAVEIPIADFLENWCVSMAKDDVSAGVNWDANMLGTEAESLRLALDLLNQLKAMQSAIKFLGYSDIDAFISDIEASAEED